MTAETSLSRFGVSSMTAPKSVGPCLGCGHAKRNHLNGVGLCIVASCRLCLTYTGVVS